MRMRSPKYKDEVILNCPFLIDKEINFEKVKPLHVEIGMGKGNFIINMALNNPDINFIGVEKYSSVAAIAIKKALEYDLPNLKMIISDVVNLEEILKNKVDVIYLNFSDPWPKKKHAKRRLTSESFLKLYDSFFKDKNMIILKTDNDALFSYSVNSLQNYGYVLEDVCYDLHASNIPNVLTEYEEKFSKEGIKIKYLKASK